MSMKTRAGRDGDDWILNGSKHFISGPVMPDFAIVFAATGVDETPQGQRKRVTAFLVDVGTQGFDIATAPHCVSYRGYQHFPAELSTTAACRRARSWARRAGAGARRQVAGMGRVWVGASCCGKAERLFGWPPTGPPSRKQFGKPIGQFQGTGFKLADMAIELRAADLLVADAVRKADAGTMTEPTPPWSSSTARRCWAGSPTTRCRSIGGMGLMDELPVERMWRDARLERIWDGTSEIQRHIIARSLLRRAAHDAGQRRNLQRLLAPRLDRRHRRRRGGSVRAKQRGAGI